MTTRLPRPRHPAALLALALVSAGVAACAPADSPAPEGSRADAIRAAETFIAALNDENVAALARVSQTPFAFREQEWTNAPDGSGFVLAEAKDRVLSEPATLEAFFVELVQRVATDSRSAAPNPSPREALLAKQLAGAPAAWGALELLVFLRGEGDVEHIAIVGVDRRTLRVAGLYVN